MARHGARAWAVARCRGCQAQRFMRSPGVVDMPPCIERLLCLGQRLEHAPVEHLALERLRLADDHRLAKKLALAIAQINSSLVDPETVDTNIVGLDLTSLPITAAELATVCREKGLWISALGPKYARLVTHLDFSENECDEAIEILKSALVAK